MNLPNKLTIARVIAVPFFILAFYFGWYILAFVIFVAASLTDMLDGKIARKHNLVTNFGKIMDPLADKVLVYSALCLMIPFYVPAWMLIVILAREFTVAGMRTVAAAEGIVIAAGMSGKAGTRSSRHTANIWRTVLIFPLMPLWYVAQAFLWASLVMTVYSGAEYVLQNRHVFSMK